MRMRRATAPVPQATAVPGCFVTDQRRRQRQQQQSHKLRHDEGRMWWQHTRSMQCPLCLAHHLLLLLLLLLMPRTPHAGSSPPCARRLCCLCGTNILPNPSNMCVNCIRSQVDITEGIQKQVGRCRVCSACASCAAAQHLPAWQQRRPQNCWRRARVDQSAHATSPCNRSAIGCAAGTHTVTCLRPHHTTRAHTCVPAGDHPVVQGVWPLPAAAQALGAGGAREQGAAHVLHQAH
jgi:hypothetical protein